MKLAFCIAPLKNENKSRGMGYYAKNLLDQLKAINGLEIQEFENIKEVEQADIVHFPFFDLFYLTLPSNFKFKTVVTVPDITPLIFSKQYPKGIKGLIKNKIQL